MWSKIKLSDVEVRQLRMIAQKAPRAKYRERAEALLKIDTGIPGPDIAREYGVCNQTVYNWLTIFRDRNGAVEWLKNSPATGRGKCWPKAATPYLLRLLRSKPEDYGYSTSSWSARLLIRHLKRDGFMLGKKMVLSAVKRLGYEYDQSQGTYIKRTGTVASGDTPVSRKLGPGDAAAVTPLVPDQTVSFVQTVRSTPPFEGFSGAVVIDACYSNTEVPTNDEPKAQPERQPRRRGRPPKKAVIQGNHKGTVKSSGFDDIAVEYLRDIAESAPVAAYRERAKTLLATGTGLPV
jgi:transposase